MPDNLPAVVNLDVLTVEILFLKHQTARNMIEIGRRLIQAKEMVGHGNWGAYLLSQVKFSERTAQNFMRVAREYGGNPQAIADLEPTKVFTIMEAEPEERPALIEMAPKVSTRELEAQQQTLAEERRRREEAERKATEAERLLAQERQLRAEADRRFDKASKELAQVKSREPAVIEKPIDKPETLQKLAGVERQLKEAQTKLQQPDLLARDVTALKQQIEDLSAERDQQATLREEALKVNMALSELQDVVTRHRGLFQTAKAKEYGDWIDLQGIYDTETLLQDILRDFHRITKDCVRR